MTGLSMSMTQTAAGELDSADTLSGLAPTSAAARIGSLDLLRGFALLGILIVNIQSYAMIGVAYMNPNAYGEFTGANFWTWWITYVFFDSKMMAMFSILFGAGIILMTERAKEKTGRSFWLHCRRMFWLLLFGLIHAHIFWIGDILYTYAICGMFVFLFRNAKPKTLFIVCAIILAVPVVLYSLMGVALNFSPPEAIAQMRSEWTPGPEQIAVETEAMLGSLAVQIPYRSMVALVMETFVFGLLFFWRAAGLMLFGMAMFKLGILQGNRSPRFYVKGIMVGLLVGFVFVVAGTQANVAQDFDMTYSYFFGTLPNYVGSLFVTFGYICALVLFFKCDCLTWLKHSLQSVGRMALSNYLAHTLICTTLFYGHGLGWFGKVERIEQLMIVIAIWIVQMIVSPIWLSKFRFGPFEWLWRSLVYWKLQPMFRGAG